MARIGSKEWLALAIGTIMVIGQGMVGWPRSSAIAPLDTGVDLGTDSQTRGTGSVNVGRKVADEVPAQPPPTNARPATKTITLTLHVRRGDTDQVLANQEVWHHSSRSRSHGNFESKFKKKAHLSMTDDQGVLEVNLPVRGTMFFGTTFFARQSHLLGRLRTPAGKIDELDGTTYSLELFPERAVTIRTIDHQSQPVTGIQISASWITPPESHDSTETFWYSLGNTTGPNARFHWTGLSLDLRQKKPTATGLHLRARILGGEGEIVELTTLPAHGSTIDLRLPPMGQLTIALLDPLGRPVTGKGRINLRRLLPGSEGLSRHSRYGYSREYAQGQAHYPIVALDSLFEVAARGTMGKKLAKREIIGPTAHDPHPTKTLTLGGNLLLLRGRAVDAEGNPIANKQLSCYLNTGNDYETANTKSGDDGRFLAILPGRVAGKQLTAAHINLSRSNAEYDLMHLTPFRRGFLELGEAVFAENAALLTGRVIAAAGAPCTNYSLRVEHRSHPSMPWKLARIHNAIDGDRFRISGIPKAGDYRLQVSPAARCHIPPEPIEFIPGMKEVEVRLERGHTLAVRLRTPRDPEQFLRLQTIFKLLLRPVSGRALDRVPGDRSEGIGLSNFGEPVDPDREVYWNGLVEGTYQCEVSITGTPSPFHIVGPIQVPTASGALARATLDLTQDLAEIHLSFKSIDGTVPTTRVKTHLLHDNRFLSARSSEQNRISMTVIPGAFDVWVLARGYMPTLLRSIRSDREVTLTPSATPLHVRIGNNIRLPESISMRATLQAAANLPPGWVLPKIEGKEPDSRRLSFSPFSDLQHYWPAQCSGMFDSGGNAQFEAQRAGPHTISLELIPTSAASRTRWNRASIPITDFSPKHFDLQPSTSTQTLTLQVTQAVIDAALREAIAK